MLLPGSFFVEPTVAGRAEELFATGAKDGAGVLLALLTDSDAPVIHKALHPLRVLLRWRTLQPMLRVITASAEKVVAVLT